MLALSISQWNIYDAILWIYGIKEEQLKVNENILSLFLSQACDVEFQTNEIEEEVHRLRYFKWKLHNSVFFFEHPNSMNANRIVSWISLLSLLKINFFFAFHLLAVPLEDKSMQSFMLSWSSFHVFRFFVHLYMTSKNGDWANYHTRGSVSIERDHCARLKSWFNSYLQPLSLHNAACISNFSASFTMWCN